MEDPIIHKALRKSEWNIVESALTEEEETRRVHGLSGAEEIEAVGGELDRQGIKSQRYRPLKDQEKDTLIEALHSYRETLQKRLEEEEGLDTESPERRRLLGTMAQASTLNNILRDRRTMIQEDADER